MQSELQATALKGQLLQEKVYRSNLLNSASVTKSFYQDC